MLKEEGKGLNLQFLGPIRLNTVCRSPVCITRLYKKTIYVLLFLYKVLGTAYLVALTLSGTLHVNHVQVFF